MQPLYSEFMDEYKNLNYMDLVEVSEPVNDSYYIPHHWDLYRPDKSTTHLSAIFNVSASTTSGLSLNDIILKGTVTN